VHFHLVVLVVITFAPTTHYVLHSVVSVDVHESSTQYGTAVEVVCVIYAVQHNYFYAQICHDQFMYPGWNMFFFLFL